MSTTVVKAVVDCISTLTFVFLELDKSNSVIRMNATLKSKAEAKLDQLLTQKDKTELIDRIEQNKTELIDCIQKVEVNLTYRIQQNKTEVLDRMQKIETSLTKQVYIVGLIQFLAIGGALIGIINFALK